MPLRGRLAIALQLNIFRNIDLFQQGLYELRITLHHIVDDIKIYARPTDVYKATTLAPNTHLCLCPPHIIDEDSAFCSRIMLIRYSEEEIQLHDVAVFTTDIDMEADFSSPPLIMEVELLFSDVSASSATLPTDELAPDKIMRSVSTAEYRIYNPCKGHCEFIRFAFDDMHFASVTSTLHCLLINCHFTALQLQASDLEAARMGRMRVAQSEEELTAEEVSREMFPGGDEVMVGSEETNRAYERVVMGFAEGLGQLSGLMEKFLVTSKPRNWTPGKLSLPETCRFSDLVATHTGKDISSSILEYMKTVSSYSLSLFDLLLLALQDHPWEIAYLLKEKYMIRMREMASDAIFREMHRWSEAEAFLPSNIISTHKHSAQSRRCDSYFSSQSRHSIVDIIICPEPQSHPIFFDEAYVSDTLPVPPIPKPIPPPQTRKKRHLVVLVHGFGGTAFDVRMLKNHIYQEYPDVMIHSAHSNEDEGTNGDILIMGGKLATEVQSYIAECFPKNSLQKLSFIGHSMGGLIIRAALPLLADQKSKLHFYISLSTPHLGYLHKTSKLIDVGICLLKLFKSSLSLSQMTLKDCKNKRMCALYSLSTFKGLEWFSHVFFFGSAQDAYAPLESARVQLSEETRRRPKSGEILSEMVHNIIASLRPESLRRVDVSFSLKQAGLDRVIGRAAHIQFLENSALMRTLVFGFPELFESY